MIRRLVAAVAALVLASGPAEALSTSDPVIFASNDGGILRVQGHGGYFGALEVRKAGSRHELVNELGLEEYIQGLAEMPPSWPMEALKAQAVAARSYALWEMKQGNWKPRGYDVCGTTACQVFDGVAPIERANGERWREAVLATKGQVLIDGGSPILARFHSSSGGTTLDNEIVYPSSGRRDYLVSVDDPSDAVSPLHTWSVRFSNEQMTAILRRAFQLNGDLVEILTDPVARTLSVRTGGGQLDMNIVRFRREVSSAAAALFPDSYPSERSDGERLPLVLPSSRFEVTRDGSDWVIEGRGYGHGVGMSQWGARGMADAGSSYREILSHYYGGLKPTTDYEVPSMVRVGLGSVSGDLLVSPSGPMAISSGGSEVSAGTLGTWTLYTDRELEPPAGWDAEPAVDALGVPAEVHLSETDVLPVSIVLPKNSIVRAVVSRADRTVSEFSAVLPPGSSQFEVPLSIWKIRDSGEYQITVTAFDGTASATADAVVSVHRPGRKAAWLATILVALAVFWVWRSRHRTPSAGPSR